MSSTAVRLRRYRARQRDGIRVATVELAENTVSRLVAAKFLTQEEVSDRRSLNNAVSDFVELAAAGRLTRSAE